MLSPRRLHNDVPETDDSNQADGHHNGSLLSYNQTAAPPAMTLIEPTPPKRILAELSRDGAPSLNPASVIHHPLRQATLELERGLPDSSQSQPRYGLGLNIGDGAESTPSTQPSSPIRSRFSASPEPMRQYSRGSHASFLTMTHTNNDPTQQPFIQSQRSTIDLRERRVTLAIAESPIPASLTPSGAGRTARRPTGDSKMSVMSSSASYRANFTTLGGISIFGASAAFSAIFSGARGDIVVLSWSAALFVLATIAAGGMGIIVDSGIHLDDITARRFVRAFAMSSALCAFAGILNLTMAVLEISDASGGSFVLDSRSRRLSVLASCYFTISVAVVLIVVAVFVRFRHGKSSWKL